MTGTASEFIDYYRTNNNSLINFELFSVRLFGNINANCELNDITQYGCSILTPKDINLPTDIFNLLIMSPDDDKKLFTVITAEIRRIDSHNSVEHDIAGMKFLDVEADTRDEINVLMQRNITGKKSRIKCCLLKN